MWTHKKFQVKTQNLDLAVNRYTHPRRMGMHNYTLEIYLKCLFHMHMRTRKMNNITLKKLNYFSTFCRILTQLPDVASYHQWLIFKVIFTVNFTCSS